MSSDVQKLGSSAQSARSRRGAAPTLRVAYSVASADGLDADEYRQPVQALAPVRVQRHFQRELERLWLAIAVGVLGPRPQLAGPQRALLGTEKASGPVL